jgi:hypothetical protein
MTKKFMKWTWKPLGMFVFQDLKSIVPKPVTAAAMQARLKEHLRIHNLDDGEILHGLRAGGALTRAIEGESLKEIMAQAFWKCPGTAMRYIGILKHIMGEEFLQEVKRRHGKILSELPKGEMEGIPHVGN